MPRAVRLVVLVVALLACWAPRPAAAAEPEAWQPTGEEVLRTTQAGAYARTTTQLTPRKRWDFEIAVPAWIPGVSGSFASGGVEVDADRDLEALFDKFFDVATSLDFAFVGRVEARTGPWTFTADAFGASLGNDINFTLTDGTVADATIKAFIGAAHVGYRVWTKPACLFGARSCLKVDAYAGARFYYAEYELKLPRGGASNDSGSWIDPIVGFDAELGIGRRWFVHLRSDVGGFGVGADFSLWVVAGLEYRFTHVFSLALGWATMTSEYAKGSGTDRFAWNLSLSGPQVVLAFRF